MSIHVHATGVLLRDPEQRTSSKGSRYTTGLIKASSKEGDSVADFTCFDDGAQRDLLQLTAGDAVTVAGLGKLAQGSDKDGEQHGLSIVTEHVLTHRPREQQQARTKPLRYQQQPARSSDRQSTIGISIFDGMRKNPLAPL